MALELALVGVNHHRAPLDVREELSFSRQEAIHLLPQVVAVSGISEALLLSTCNRTEFYLAYDGGPAVEPLLEILKKTRRQARALHNECLRYVEIGEHAARHLFRVAAGIDSQILGDTYIVRQVKEAHRTAADAGTLGPLLDRTVTESLRAAKRARRETAIGRGAVSVGAAVLRSVRRFVADLTTARVMILGGGDAGRDIACHLSKVKLGGLLFAARNAGQAQLLAREFRGEAIDWDWVPEGLAAVDVVVAATSARLSVLDRSVVEGRIQARSTTLLLVDAGVPRNVDVAVGDLPHVRLLNLDSLDREQEQALAARRAEIPRVEAILAEELERWRRWRRRRAAAPGAAFAIPVPDGAALSGFAGRL